jgi:hypothetical protein
MKADWNEAIFVVMVVVFLLAFVAWVVLDVLPAIGKMIWLGVG